MMRMDDDPAFISPNGPKSHIIVKIGLERNIKFELKNFPNCSPYVFEQKKLEANLKGLPWGFKRATKKEKKLIPLLN
jgi:hypothetical protein